MGFHLAGEAEGLLLLGCRGCQRHRKNEWQGWRQVGLSAWGEHSRETVGWENLE